MGCYKKPGKSYVYVKAKCANCEGSYSTDSAQYIQRYKAEIDARKKNNFEKEKAKSAEDDEQDQTLHEASLESEIKMDLEAEY